MNNLLLYFLFFIILIFLFKKNELFDNTTNFKNVIVKIYAQDIEYDFEEPYKNDESYESIGTGFFIKKNIILTASHVIQDSIRVDITIPKIGKKKFKAEVIAVHPHFDFGLLKVLDCDNNEYLELGDSKNVKQGDNVIAIGYPLAQDKLKITSGVVSGLHNGEIQTDAPINPGNSGGPLIDENNKVIGINVSGYTMADNIGYAVPIHRYIKYEKKILNGETLLFKPILGCRFSDLNQEYLDYHNIKNNEGVLITDVFKNGPLDLSSLKQGDVLTKFDNYHIDRYGQVEVDWFDEKLKFNELFDEYLPHDVIDIEYFRNNKKFKTKVELLPYTFYKIRNYFPQFEKIDYSIISGMIFMDFNKDHLDMFGGKSLCKYKNLKNRSSEKIILTNIMIGSYVNNLEILKSGLILSKINNIEINKVENLKNEFIKLVNKKEKYIIFKFENGIELILELEKIVNEDLFLKEKYKYEIFYLKK